MTLRQGKYPYGLLRCRRSGRAVWKCTQLFIQLSGRRNADENKQLTLTTCFFYQGGASKKAKTLLTDEATCFHPAGSEKRFFY